MAIFEPLRKLLRSTLYCRKPSLPLDATPAPILQLPVDVLLYIMNRIPPAEAAALALSSKAILSAVGFKVLRIERIEDRVELLKHLEVFFPEHLLCYQCGKFHRLRNEVYSYEEDTECDRKNGRFWFNSRILDLPFTRAQEIMNRHRYGKRHGISLRNLNRFHSWHVNYYDRRFEQTRAKIVDGQLFIRTDIRFSPLIRTPNEGYQGCRYCPHQTSWNFKPSEFDHIKTTFIRCLECPTEIRLDRDFWYPYYLGTTRTTVWCNLGRCSSPFEFEWRALIHPTDQASMVYISQDEARYIHLF